MKTVCMICHREILPDGSSGQVLPPARGYSHGCCFQCLPEFCRQSGLDERQTADIVASMSGLSERTVAEPAEEITNATLCFTE